MIRIGGKVLRWGRVNSGAWCLEARLCGLEIELYVWQDKGYWERENRDGEVVRYKTREEAQKAEERDLQQSIGAIEII